MERLFICCVFFFRDSRSAMVSHRIFVMNRLDVLFSLDWLCRIRCKICQTERHPPPRTLPKTQVSNELSTTLPTYALGKASASPWWFLMDMLEVGARSLVSWISHRLSTTLRTPSDINLELAQRITLRHSIVTPRVPFCDVFDWLPQRTTPHSSVLTTGGPHGTIWTRTPGQLTSTPH